jgi:hypothetical protein
LAEKIKILQMEDFYYLRSSSIFCVKFSYGYAPSIVAYFPVFLLRMRVPGVPLRPNSAASAVCAAKTVFVSFLSTHSCHVLISSFAFFAASASFVTG